MNNINCPCCNQNITQISNTILDNIRYPLNKSCVFCLCEMNSINNKDKLVSCIQCGNLFHSKCFDEYIKHKSKSNEPPINNVYNHFVFNPLLTPIRTEVNNLYMGSQFINSRSSYILYPIRL